VKLKRLGWLKLGKDGKHKNALSYPYNGFTPNVPSPYAAPLLTPSSLVSQPGLKAQGTGWLDYEQAHDEKLVVVLNTRVVSHYQLVLEKYDALVSRLLMDLAVSAHWNRWNTNLLKVPRILKKHGEEINGWGWVVYRVHSTGEASLPDQPEPHNYTLFNFWQVSFTNGHNPDLTPDMRLWHLHVLETLEDFERLTSDQVEKWLKTQLYQMSKTGCLWVALPDLINEKGKRRKPTIQDALHTYNVLSFGRNYDPYQTEAHFYDRPPYQNQFLPGYFKR
jgi:hypothetical protein